MKLKLAGIALKWPQNGTKTKVTHRRVKVSRFYSISLPYFEILSTIVTSPYKLLYLRCYTMSYNNVHGLVSLGYLWSTLYYFVRQSTNRWPHLETVQ